MGDPGSGDGDVARFALDPEESGVLEYGGGAGAS
jgi:hypothetical protein